ncbi:hypothetical protein [Parabacteroides sp. Marseille-P3160]|uniref:hypothetical protein n=1 Tax=Parabacteroides sp. Marseille-P3160 TaxID=1917887 RepID=UPI00190E703D|nr:hypothetical protein [Parabacteroides sp. Marseille-P3160]
MAKGNAVVIFMSTSKLKIYLDDTVKDSELFQSKKEFEICKPEIFKYGIMMEEIPNHIKEADFDYLQSKVPAYDLLHSDFINLYTNRIENISNDDRKKKLISEIIGVAFGIKYTTELLKTNPNKFKKIGVPDDGKYLDYSIIEDNKEYELETKGTVAKYYSTFKNDILQKKKDQSSKNVFLRFGTIAMINSLGDTKKSQCVIVDDPPNEDNVANDKNSFEVQLLNYGIFLSYILDSKYFNRYIKPLKQKKIKKVKIDKNKFFTKYIFSGKEFYGECFDYRLIRENEYTNLNLSEDKTSDFQERTRLFGKTKFFIGVDSSVIETINRKDIESLKNYKSNWIFEDKELTTRFLDKDGILIVKSKDGDDKQLERVFPEKEVEKRLGLSIDQQRGIAHKCGAPCRSKEIKGKPCEIRTYREYCHFHR